MPSPLDDCRARLDSEPRDVCRVCNTYLLLRKIGGPEAGLEACANPLCKAAHGVRCVDGVLEVRDATGETWRAAAETFDLLPSDERARRTRLAWWADLTDEHRVALIGQCCRSCGKLDPSCRCGDDS